MSDISIPDKSRKGEAAARGWRGDTHACPPGVCNTRIGPPQTHAAPAHPALGRAPPRLSGSRGDANAVRGTGSPGATRWGPSGIRAQGSPLLRVAGARAADAPSWPTRAPGGLRAPATTDRYREGPRRRRAEPGAVEEERRSRERRERREQGGDAPKRSLRPPGPSRVREDIAQWLPERPGSALPPCRAVRAARPPFSLGWLAATSVRLCPPPSPPASRLHDNSAPTPRPAPPPRHRDSEGAGSRLRGDGVSGGQRPIRGLGKERKGRGDRKGPREYPLEGRSLRKLTAGRSQRACAKPCCRACLSVEWV